MKKKIFRIKSNKKSEVEEKYRAAQYNSEQNHSNYCESFVRIENAENK